MAVAWMGWGEVSLFGPGTCCSIGYVLRVCYLQQGILELVQIFILTDLEFFSIVHFAITGLKNMVCYTVVFVI